ncbi:MAG: PRTRC system ThiF family protein [Terrimonas sp.]|nr:PRTRC system ThiF family protein [Terrimonas sp.]
MKTKTQKPAIHFVEPELLHPYNPVRVNLIGAGGTGSQVLTALARINHSLIALRHPGLMTTVFDDDTVTAANLGRQLFTTDEIGLQKSAVLINRINRFFGTNWKAVSEKFNKKIIESNPDYVMAGLTISCVDSVAARFEIASILAKHGKQQHYRNRPLYWMDFGNRKNTGQVILSTVGTIKQAASKKFRTVDKLPFVTTEFKDLLHQSEQNDDTPSCSLAEALTRQDLFINSALANLGASLLWQLFREGMITNRGFFLNLAEFRAQPLKVA